MSGSVLATEKRSSLIAVPQLVGILLVVALLHQVASEQFLLFHTLVEMLRIVVLCGLFALAWHTREWSGNQFLKVVGIAAIFIAGFELFHTLSYRGIGSFGVDDGNLPTQLWIAFRYLEAVAFLLAALLIARPVRAAWLVGLFGALSAALILLLVSGLFPDSHVDSQGLTPFKIASEYCIALSFLLAMVLLYRQRARFEPRVHWLIQASLVCNTLSSLAFTQYVSVYGFANEVGHYFLFLSAYLVYRGVLVTALVAPYQLMFRDLKHHQEHLADLVAERTDQLQRSELLNRNFIEHSPAATVLTNPEGKITLTNPAFDSLTGKAGAEITGKSVFEVASPELAAAVDRGNQAARLAGKAITTTEALRLHGEPRLFDAVHFPLFDQDGQLTGIGAIGTEVTEHRRLQANYELMVNASMDALLLIDTEGNFVQVNQAAVELTGYREDELLSMNLCDIDADPEAGALSERLGHSMDEKAGRFESRWRRKNGNLRDVEISVQVFDGVVTNGFCAFVRDITRQRADLRRIEFLARFDALTELPNRSRFEELARHRLHSARRTGQKALLVYIDLDNFKDINDSLGHCMGDALLRELGERLRALADRQRLLARASGDEFIALLEVPPASGEAVVATEVARIQQAISSPVSIDGHQLLSTVSIGVALFPDDGQDYSTLYRNADTAMYAAKASGRNTYRRFDKAMQERASERQTLLAELRGARQRGELSLHYQPQLDLTEGRVVGAEALLRWHHPELGPVSPARFIPIAEESGLIVEIGEWVLRKVCLRGRAWQRAGLPPITLAVNVSAIQFQRPDLPATVARVLAETGFDGRHLELELTESVLAGDEARVADTIGQLKQHQVRVAIDDFGTGYSSMAYLNRFAVDKLKIDQSFIRDMATDHNSASVVTAIISLAHSLGLKVIAEGVETEQQVAQLRQLNCDEAQGYHFGRPMPAGAFEASLRRLPEQT
ncbi:MAG: EAL domain-containing protein [Marinobacter sp.]